MISVAEHRAKIPAGANQVLDRRTLETNQATLIPFLKPGMTVLDVGCGTGAITGGIARRVYPGKVVGIDVSTDMIQQASRRYELIGNISFEPESIFDFEPSEKFDVVTSSRTFQWLSNPEDALERMKALTVRGGVISVLDYNHDRIEWKPSPPGSMRYFYQAFLAWREDAGMSNRMGDELPGCFSKLGLADISVVDASESSLQGDKDFSASVSIWSIVAETRGKQMVVDNYITEADRVQAIADYDSWIADGAFSMKLNLKGVTGVKMDAE